VAFHDVGVGSNTARQHNGDNPAALQSRNSSLCYVIIATGTSRTTVTSTCANITSTTDRCVVCNVPTLRRVAVCGAHCTHRAVRGAQCVQGAAQTDLCLHCAHISTWDPPLLDPQLWYDTHRCWTHNSGTHGTHRCCARTAHLKGGDTQSCRTHNSGMGPTVVDARVSTCMRPTDAIGLVLLLLLVWLVSLWELL
jgi:hypothetical protein